MNNETKRDILIYISALVVGIAGGVLGGLINYLLF
jgi:hypothetical protein